MLRSTGKFSPRYRMTLIAGGGLAFALASVLLFPRVGVLGVWPDVMTLYALFFTLFNNERGRYLPCMALGLLRDVFSAGPFGTYAILYGLLYRLLMSRRKSLYRDNPLTLLAIAFLAVVLINLGYHATLVMTGAGIGWTDAGLRALSLGAVTAPFMLPLTWLMKAGLARAGVERMPGGLMNV